MRLSRRHRVDPPPPGVVELGFTPPVAPAPWSRAETTSAPPTDATEGAESAQAPGPVYPVDSINRLRTRRLALAESRTQRNVDEPRGGHLRPVPPAA